MEHNIHPCYMGRTIVPIVEVHLMDFMYSIHFHTAEKEIRRTGSGQFYPSDVSFKIEDMLWAMAETYGRPEKVEIRMSFVREGM